MLRAVLLASLAGAILAQQSCDINPVGDETVENAVPIAEFYTSGKDFVRPSWCIAHCKERISIVATMRFKPYSNNSAVYNVKRQRHANGRVTQHVELKSGEPVKRENPDDPFNFCIDTFISSVVDAVMDRYNDTETIAQGLNYYINKPNWAYLVYKMGPPPSLISTENVHYDRDFCMKTPTKVVDGQFLEWQIYAGAINDDGTFKAARRHN